MDRGEQTNAAAKRFRDTAEQREEIKRRQEAEGSRVVDTPEQIRARITRLAEGGLVRPEAMVAAAPTTEGVQPNVLLERIIGATSELQAVSFLARGAQVARTVARISEDRHGRRIPFGTGFLVSPRLLLTNNHVFPDPSAAEHALAEFNAEAPADNEPVMITSYRFDPEALFLTDEHLDYTLVAVKPGADGRAPGDVFGWNHLMSQQGKLVTGEPVNLVGHPMGRLKEIAVRDNALQQQLDDFLHYVLDTEPGNSGSPVFNDQWEVVALHHSGVPRTDESGNWLQRDGSTWRPEHGDAAIDWTANEGIRVSVLLRHLADQPRTAAHEALLAEMGPHALPTDTVAATAPAPVGAHTAGVSSAPTPAGRVERATPAGRAGLPARHAPFGTQTHLVFLHGRGQEGKDPGQLRAKWAAGLTEGLALAGLPAVDAADAWFPFYGDALVASLDTAESVAVREDATGANLAEALAPRDPSARATYESLIMEAAEHAGLPSGSAEAVIEQEGLANVVGPLHTVLTWLADRSGLDELFIASVFRDVATYLDRDEVRQRVLDTVLEELPTSGRIVLVSHSLGTVVAADLLTRLPRQVEVAQLVTAGSPLGMDSVFKRLLAGGPVWPTGVAAWLNAWYPGDAVAIGCPLRRTWGTRVTDVIANNPADRAHSIEAYLAHRQVAGPIGTAIGAAAS